MNDPVVVYNPEVTGLRRRVGSMSEDDLFATSSMTLLVPMIFLGVPCGINWNEGNYIAAVILSALLLAVVGGFAWMCATWATLHKNTFVCTGDQRVVGACQAWVRFQRLASSSPQFADEYRIGLPALHRAMWAMAVLAEPAHLDERQEKMLQSRLDEITNFVTTMEELAFTATGLNVDGSSVQHLKLQMQSLVEMMEGGPWAHPSK